MELNGADGRFLERCGSEKDLFVVLVQDELKKRSLADDENHSNQDCGLYEKEPQPREDRINQISVNASRQKEYAKQQRTILSIIAKMHNGKTAVRIDFD